jgi:uncharacterized integral membrane protein
MIRFLRLLVLVLLGIALLTVAIANRDVVTVKLLPAGLAALLGVDWQMQLPLFLVILGGVAVGILIGFFWEWAREHKHRSAAKSGSRQVTQLERELAVLKDSTSAPPKDDILALLDRPKAR